MLRWRLTLGVVFVAAIALLAYLDVQMAKEQRLPPGALLVPLALSISWAATNELFNFLKDRVPDSNRRVVQVGNWLIVASAWFGAGFGGVRFSTSLVFVGAVLLVFFAEIFRYDKDKSKQVTERIGVSVLALAYIGLLLSMIVQLRLVRPSIFPLLSMLVIVKMGDIGAYTVGRMFGKRKLAPKLSPGKTWEGLFGGLLFSILGLQLLTAMFNQSGHPVLLGRMPFTYWFVYPVVVCLAGVMGDLAESLLKRDCSRKDSSDWMPGFGGVLDLIDSLLFAAPVAWVFWEFRHTLFIG